MTAKHNKDIQSYLEENKVNYHKYNDDTRFTSEIIPDIIGREKIYQNELNPDKIHDNSGDRDPVFVFLPELLSALQKAIKVLTTFFVLFYPLFLLLFTALHCFTVFFPFFYCFLLFLNGFLLFFLLSYCFYYVTDECHYLMCLSYHVQHFYRRESEEKLSSFLFCYFFIFSFCFITEVISHISYFATISHTFSL